MTEAPDFNGISPVKIDIDLKYQQDSLVRMYDEKLVNRFIEYYYEKIDEYVSFSDDDERLCFMFEKSKPIIDKKNKSKKDEKSNLVNNKDGIHFMMPFLVTKWSLQHKLRDHSIKRCKEENLFGKFNLTIPICEI